MFCRFCGKPVSIDDRFCAHCGKQLGPDNDIKKFNLKTYGDEMSFSSEVMKKVTVDTFGQAYPEPEKM